MKRGRQRRCPRASPSAACARRVELAAADGTWTQHHRHSESVHHRPGVVLYRDGVRLSSTEALTVLGDDHLRALHHDRLAGTAGDATMYPIWSLTSRGLLATGAGLVAGGIAYTYTPPDGPAGAAMAFSGLGALLATMVTTILGLTAFQGAVDHELDAHLLLRDGARLLAAARAYNERVAASCGAQAEGDVPGTQRALSAVELMPP